MATCNHCGYKHATDGKFCPACGKKVQDNTLAYIAIIGILILILALIVGPAFLFYKAYKTTVAQKTNWWLSGAILSSILVICIATIWKDLFFKEGVLSSILFYVNMMILLGALVVFFLRLKNLDYQFAKLFKTQNNEN